MLRTKRRGAIPILILLLIILLLILLLIWYAFWYKPKQAEPTASSTPTVSASETPAPSPSDPYSGWQTSTLTYEKFSFKYPADWKYSNKDSVEEGSDRVKLTSPDGFVVSISTNLYGIGGNCEDCKNFEMVQDDILGMKVGVNITGTSKGAMNINLMRSIYNNQPIYECSAMCDIPGKNTKSTLNDGSPGLTMVSGGYEYSEAQAAQVGFLYKTVDYNTFKNDPNVATARLIFKSFSY
jgi:hypothetical protein